MVDGQDGRFYNWKFLYHTQQIYHYNVFLVRKTKTKEYSTSTDHILKNYRALFLPINKLFRNVFFFVQTICEFKDCCRWYNCRFMNGRTKT